MVLCSGFTTRITLITCWCFNCCRAVLTLSQGLLSFSHCPASEEAGGSPGAGRGQNQESWPKLAQGMSHTMWCHAEQLYGVLGWLPRVGGRPIYVMYVPYMSCIVTSSSGILLVAVWWWKSWWCVLLTSVSCVLMGSLGNNLLCYAVLP